MNNQIIVKHVIIMILLFCTKVFAMKTEIKQLPKPTGPYPVGTVSYHLIDKTRQEQHVQDPEHPYRELMVHVWYPATLRGDEQCAAFVSEHLAQHIKENASKKGYFEGAGYVAYDVTTNSFSHATIAQEKTSYPVVIFSHGICYATHGYTSFFEELASHGFIVVAPNHTYSADPVEFTDGRITELVLLKKDIDPFKAYQDKDLMDREYQIWLDDITFILDEIERINKHDQHGILNHKLDVNKIGVMGHSFGASTVVSTWKQDPRCKALISMDGFVTMRGTNQDCYDKPLMIMNPAGQKIDPTTAQAGGFDMTAIIEKAKKEAQQLCSQTSGTAYEIRFDGHHLTFSDYFMLTGSSQRHDHEMKNLELIKALSVGFFKKHLCNESNSLDDVLQNSSVECII